MTITNMSRGQGPLRWHQVQHATERVPAGRKNVRSQMPEPPGKKRRRNRPRAFVGEARRHVGSMTERFNGWAEAFRRVLIRFDRLPQV